MAQTRLKRLIWVADNHGDMVDQKAEKEFFQFADYFKADERIHLGDFMNLAAARKGADETERQMGVKDDIRAGIDFVRRFKTTVLLWGNHDYRLVRCVRDGGGISREYAKDMHDEILKDLRRTRHIHWGKREGHYRSGNTISVHGYSGGINAARQVATTYAPGIAMCGHVHTESHVVMPTLVKNEGHTVSCLCQLDQEYNLGHQLALRQTHGWAYGVQARNGETAIWHAKKINGKWVFPSEITQL